MVLHKRFLFINDGNEMKFIEGPVVTISKDDNYGETDELIFFYKLTREIKGNYAMN